MYKVGSAYWALFVGINSLIGILNSMRNCYVDFSHRAILDLILYRDKDLLLTRINVPKVSRGLGVGSRLLQLMLKDADSSGTVIWLEILSSGPLDKNDLVAWYKRNGFQTVGISLMRRVPK